MQIPDAGAQIDNLPLELGFVIDRSVSMQPLKSHLVSAFNTLLAEQAAPNTFGTLILFNHDSQCVANGMPIGQMPKLDAIYHPAGNTALLDGIGKVINQIGRRFDEIRFRVLIAIFTDGLENSSQFFVIEEIAEMIKNRQTVDAWQFILITPRAGISFGLHLGIPRENIVNFEASAAGISRIIGKLSKTIRAYRLGDKRYYLQLTS
jgi:hypothetical protein